MFNGTIPDIWAAVAYPSLKPLGAWVNDLLARLKFLQTWLDQGPPAVFWLSGFFFTQSFLTGVRQNYARRHHMAIDKLSYDFVVVPDIKPNDASVTAPTDGCYVYGMFLDGAAWDYSLGVINEAAPKQLFSVVPTIWLKPGVTVDIEEARAKLIRYPCPTYKTSRRAGTLSTTGHSTNFLLFMQLPSEKPEHHWVLRGVAMLTALDT
jgi:dynein heavy chain